MKSRLGGGVSSCGLEAEAFNCTVLEEVAEDEPMLDEATAGLDVDTVGARGAGAGATGAAPGAPKTLPLAPTVAQPLAGPEVALAAGTCKYCQSSSQRRITIVR